MAGPRLDLVHKAIRAGVWGNIQWKDAAIRVMLDNPGMEGFTPKGIRLQLRDFVLQGGCVDVRNETRTEKLEEDPDNPYWYRAVIPVPEFAKGLFVEVKLIYEDENEPFVEIVSAHPQR